jgi:hypothetical protein
VGQASDCASAAPSAGVCPIGLYRLLTHCMYLCVLKSADHGACQACLPSSTDVHLSNCELLCNTD